MSQFEWLTEDQNEWERPTPPEPPLPGRARQRLAALALLALAVAAGYFFYLRVTRQVDSVTAEAEAEIRASFRLLQERANAGDAEMTAALISGRDRAWTSAQQALIATGGLLQRDALSLALLDPLPPLTAIDISPNLRNAVVTATVPFQIAVGNGLTATVMLEVPYAYRRGETRWLYTPPEPAFWGETENAQGDYLDATFPARDADLARRLHRDLDQLLRRLCQPERRLNCDNRRRLTAAFGTDPALLANLRPQPARVGAVTLRALPAPSLVGRPVDQAGYSALLNGYAKQIVAPFVGAQAGYSCCARAPYFAALIDALLVDLGVQAWPLGPVDYNTLTPEQLVGAYLYGRGWEAADLADLDAAELTAVYVIVEYLLRERISDVPIARLIALLSPTYRPADWATTAEQLSARRPEGWFENGLTAYLQRRQMPTAGAPSLRPGAPDG